MAKELKKQENVEDKKVEAKKQEIKTEQISRKKGRRERTDSAVYQIDGITLMRLRGQWAKLD